MAFRQKSQDGTVRIINPRGVDPWPVGAVYMSFDSTNPADLFGGTWNRISVGRMIVGVDEGDASFSAPGAYGGEKTHTLTPAELPVHYHLIDHDHPPVTTTGGAHTHDVTRKDGVGSSTGMAQGNANAVSNANSFAESPTHSHTVDIPSYSGSSGPQGSGVAHNNLPPYLAVYIWNRTA